MQITERQAEKLLKGNYAFAQWSLSMLVTRLKSIYAKDPSSLKTCTGELGAFVVKYGNVMGDDLALIKTL